MATRLFELQERRGHAVLEMQTINDKAETENRDYTPEEDTRHKALKTELAALDRQIARATDLQEAQRSAPAILHHGRGDNFETRCREYSLRKAIASQVPGMNVDAALEKEISQELEKRSGRAANGILAPTDVFLVERRAGADVITTALPTGGPGSNIIATNLLSNQFVDLLRDAIAIQRLGARVISNLVGNADIPKLAQSASAEWVAENSPITLSDMQFDALQLRPKHIGALVEFSRNMLMQATPDIETVIRSDFAALIARGIDRVAIAGGGANEPSGILESDASDLSALAGAALSWENIVDLIGAVAGSNALQGSLAFLTNSKVTTLLAKTLKSSADTASSFILPSPGSNSLAGYPMAVTNLCPSDIGSPPTSAIVFGNFSDLILAYWSSFDLLANPFAETSYAKGNVLVRAMATADIGIRQPLSFAFMTSLLTTAPAE